MSIWWTQFTLREEGKDNLSYNSDEIKSVFSSYRKRNNVIKQSTVSLMIVGFFLTPDLNIKTLLINNSH